MSLQIAPSVMKPAAKLSILLMDGNAERRALREKALVLQGFDVLGLSDLTEAVLICQRGRYDLVLIDIRRDYHRCLACRDEIKKENPNQIVAFLVGQPKYIDLEPQPDSYVAEEHGAEWGDLLRRAVRESCKSLTQRNGFEEVRYQIALARKIKGLPPRSVEISGSGDDALAEAIFDPSDG